MGLRIKDRKPPVKAEVPFSILEEEAERIFSGTSAKAQELRMRFISLVKNRRASNHVEKAVDIGNLICEAEKIIKEQPQKLRDSQVSVGIATLLDLL